MKTSRYHLHLERCDPARNMARFYALSLEPSLFGEIVLVRRWGRIGASGRSRLDVYADETTAIRAMLALLRQKRARGYAVGQWGVRAGRRHAARRES
ncbi:hypothetical protein ASG39_18765 [Rhizobium sp. Leaf371]|uniref:WGR domain-containing protein n=1 Tax=Rhizobium sp. Leaf371 TaxID=1736355 RepID=UPI000713189D|nr:WGR domain-containing protein [Rhizobium sp. Leaf371]KQS59361.1 hypothetical protein ASG39_18765 [Rhizobium sp. Leaf371]